MAATAQKLIVEIAGDTSHLEKAFRSAGTTADGFGSKLGGVAKMAGFTAGAAALGAVTYTLKVGIGEWQQSQKVAAQTGAVLKSTGGAAGVTAKQVSDLAGALLKKSGVDDEAIQSGENLLLTFTNIRNEAGRGNDVFTQSTKTMLDMSVALGESTTSAATQLGKALNDPIKGVTALQRVGVSFTASQKEQIKALVDSGNAMGAQKLILGELNNEFGGSAEAMGKTLPGQISILKESFNNFAGELVGKMIPVLENLVAWTKEHWPEIKAAIVPVMHDIGQVIKTVMGDAEAFWDRFGGTILRVMKDVTVVIKSDLKVIADAFKIIGDLLRGDWSNLWKDVKALVGDALNSILARMRLFVDMVTGVGKAIGGGILHGINSGIQAAAGALKGAINSYIIGPINALIRILDSIKIDIPEIHIPFGPTIGGGSVGFNVAQIPALAAGGIVTRPTLAMIGEAGPEAVVPLGRGLGGTVVNITVNGWVGSDQQIAERIRNELVRFGRQNVSIFSSGNVAGGIAV